MKLATILYLPKAGFLPCRSLKGYGQVVLSGKWPDLCRVAWQIIGYYSELAEVMKKGERRDSRSEARLRRVEPCSAAPRQAGSHPVWVFLDYGFYESFRATGKNKKG